MLLSVLFENPMMFFVVIAGIVYALTIHEFAHAAVATALGDSTAKFSGRLSLNPLVHLDMFGTMMLLLAGFGWGKPVPVNIFNLKYKRWGESLVALAGPMANFVSAILFILLFKLAILFFPAENMIFSFLFYMILINLVLGVFNLIPLPPLDGSRILFATLPSRFDDFKHRFAVNGPWILILLLIADSFLDVNIFGRIFGFFIDMIYFFI
ncbi:site-2 protease family protein [bacterium]|jgi:Zn-dependent protease|nr:site-2 protease family protein [bacterium]MBT4648859.1 site-2 protease family protein [bacterium]